MSSVEFKRGHGVFAATEIKSGTVVCHFEGYIKTKGKETPQEQHLALDMTQDDFLIGWLIPKTELGIGQHIRDVTPPKFEIDPEVDVLSRICHLRDELCAYLDRRNTANVIRGPYESQEKIDILASRDIAEGEELRLFFGAEYWFERHLRKKPLLSLLILEGIFKETYKRVIAHLTKEMGENIKFIDVKDICETIDAMIAVTLRAYDKSGLQKFMEGVDLVALQEKIKTCRERLVVKF